MTLSKEDLQAISDIMEVKLKSEITPINRKLALIEQRLGNLEEFMEEIRETANSLAGWADRESRVTKVTFP